MMTRNPSVDPCSRAKRGATARILPSFAWWLSSQSASESMCSFGMIMKCTGASGWMSWKAKISASSYIFRLGISPRTILQKTQFSAPIPISVPPWHAACQRARPFRRSRKCPRGDAARRARRRAASHTAQARSSNETKDPPFRRRCAAGLRPWRPSLPRSLPRRFFSGLRRVRARTAPTRKIFPGRRPCATRPRPPAARVCRSSSVYFPRVLDHRLHRHPAPVVELLEKAAVSSGVAGDSAALFHPEQHHVLVAVEPDLAHRLHVSRLLAFFPQPLSGARPVVRFAGCRGLGERLAVHPGERQHLVRGHLLGDRRNKAVFVPLYPVEPFLCHCVRRFKA